MGKNSIQLQQLNSKMQGFAALQKVAIPPTGWIKAIRIALNMSLEQLGRKLSMTRQGVQDIENREKDGSATIKSLREAASALEMQLVYGFVPKDGSLDALIDRKAKELASQIVMRTSNTMKLEDQKIQSKELKKQLRKEQ